MVAPKDESSEAVMQWIESAGLGDYATISPRLDSVVVEASVSQIEKLLNAEYTPFGKAPNGMYIENITRSDIPQCTRRQEMFWSELWSTASQMLSRAT